MSEGIASDNSTSSVSRADVSMHLEEARSAGGWMVATGLFLAVIWWGALAALVYGGLDWPALSELPRALLIGAGIAAALPGALIIMAGYMARTNRRATAANALVLNAAKRLLSPADTAGQEGQLFADQMKQAASEIDRAMAHAISAMKAMSGEIGDERMRLESVSYASADNARDLSNRLAAEREALESLARDLKAQISEMNEAIPRQASMMVNASKQAGEEVSRADKALEGRLAGMQAAGEDLARKLLDLDALAQEASTRTESLTFAVSRVEEKLEQSRKTVDAAVRAGEVAAAAASTTGDALKDAVSSALDGARLANSEINQSTRAAAEETARALAELRIAGQAAASAIEGAARAARAQHNMLPVPDETLAYTPPAPRVAPAPELNGASYNRASAHHVNGASQAETPSAIKPPVITTPPPLVDTPDDAPMFESRSKPRVAPAPQTARSSFLAASPAKSPVTPPSVTSSPSLAEEDLFDANADALAATALNETDDAPEPLNLRRRFNDSPRDTEDDVAAPPQVVNANGHTNGNGNGSGNGHSSPNADMGWKDILSDIDREDVVAPPEGREEIAEALLENLQESGIRLPEAFRPKAKRKIASAARNGEEARRGAINDQAGKQVERVYKRLRADRDLMHLARQFHVLEEEDALNALEQTQKTNRNCSARLAAYLLLDAAGV